jgi:hypothetical protein
MADGENEVRDHFWNDPLSMVQFCEDIALGALEFEKMDESERRRLVFANARLRPAVEMMMRSLREIPNHQTQCLQESLRDAIYAALLIGRYSDATKSAAIFSQVKNAKESRPGGVSPFTDFFKKELQRGLSSADIKAKLVDDARNGKSGDFELIENETIEAVKSRKRKSGVKVERLHKMKISAIDGAISKAKKKIRRNEFPTTG